MDPSHTLIRMKDIFAILTNTTNFTLPEVAGATSPNGLRAEAVAKAFSALLGAIFTDRDAAQ